MEEVAKDLKMTGQRALSILGLHLQLRVPAQKEELFKAHLLIRKSLAIWTYMPSFSHGVRYRT